jgi:hypothetical protein
MVRCDGGGRRRVPSRVRGGTPGPVQKARELRHRRSEAQLHRSQRYAGFVRDLDLAEPPPERMTNDRVQFGWECVERGMDAMVVAAQIFELVGRGHGRGHEVGGGGGQRAAGPRARSQAIDGAAACDGHHPGDGAASSPIELSGALPQLEESLLHDVLGVIPIAQNAGGDGHRAFGVSVEQGTDRLHLPVGHACQELSISLPISLQGQRGGRPPEDVVCEYSIHDLKMATLLPFATSILPSLAGDGGRALTLPVMPECRRARRRRPRRPGWVTGGCLGRVGTDHEEAVS